MKIQDTLIESTEAVETLIGLMLGITADGIINDKEVASLKRWVQDNKKYSHVFPFCEVYEFVDNIIEDGVIDKSEKDELQEYCRNYNDVDGPLDLLKKDIILIRGFISGIVADNKINYDELKALEKWIVYHDSINAKWPYNELYNLTEKILTDGVVTEEEQREFKDFVRPLIVNFNGLDVDSSNEFMKKWIDSDTPEFTKIDNLINRDVEIIVPDHRFYITGKTRSKNKKEIADNIIRRGGIYDETISESTNYLVIGANAQPCWIYSTYSYSIEKVFNFKRLGVAVDIIDEDRLLSIL